MAFVVLFCGSVGSVTSLNFFAGLWKHGKACVVTPIGLAQSTAFKESLADDPRLPFHFVNTHQKILRSL